MGTATDTVQLASPNRPLLREALANLTAQLRRWFLPHLLGAVGIFLLVAYGTSFAVFSSYKAPWSWVGILLLLTLYGAAAFAYSLFTTCVFSLRLACVQWNDFIGSVFDLVQERTAQQVANMHVGLSKNEAKSIVRASVRDVFISLRRQERSLPCGLVLLLLGTTVAALRWVLTSKITKWSGKTIQLGKLFAGKATLAGAVFLNLHFFTTLLLLLCYGVGISILAFHIYLLCGLK